MKQREALPDLTGNKSVKKSVKINKKMVNSNPLLGQGKQYRGGNSVLDNSSKKEKKTACCQPVVN